jgi:S-DNA-T family DNA segregation ATPase FtsK/SpoIIIE
MTVRRQPGSAGRKSSQQDEGPQGASPDIVERLLRHADDLAAIVLGAGALLTSLGLLGLTTGSLIDPWATFLRRWLGWGSVLVPGAMALGTAVFVLRRQGRPVEIRWGRVIAFEVLAAAGLGLLAVIDGMSLARAEAGYAGGVIGWGLGRLLGDIFGSLGGTVALLALLAVSGFFVVRRRPGLEPSLERGVWSASSAAGQAPAKPAAAPSKTPERRQPAPESSARRIPAEFRKSFRLEPRQTEKGVRSKARDERLPPLDLLERGETAPVTSAEINRAAGLIEKTLAEFGLPVRVADFRTGPAVTQFAVEPGFVEHAGPEGEERRQKVRVSQISALASDLALALSAPTLRIEAPVPGQPYVGIEVPNRRAALVRLRPLLEGEAFQSVNSPLAIALGRDVSGAPVAADLVSMPHLLVAGTTGSGKSVCLTALTACLAMNNTPDDLRLVLIDPKMVELVRFNGLPHLLGKVETDLERIVGVLRWCTVEMDRRYRLLEQAKARDIEAYNRRARRQRSMERLPRIVVLLDELADLMMMAPDQTERTLVRLAQMARATGLHLVVATQRPSTDIVTGLIKANFPARISFAVASGVDSRVILDGPGAETLLGRGDMLFISPEAGTPVRVQGAYVSDVEIERLVEYWQAEMADVEEAEPKRAPWEELLTRRQEADEKDEILEQAIELVKRTGQASASMLQRRLRLGYPRAARLMDQLEDLGVIGRAQSGGRTREVLIRSEDEEEDFEDDEAKPEE